MQRIINVGIKLYLFGHINPHILVMYLVFSICIHSAESRQDKEETVYPNFELVLVETRKHVVYRGFTKNFLSYTSSHLQLTHKALCHATSAFIHSPINISSCIRQCVFGRLTPPAPPNVALENASQEQDCVFFFFYYSVHRLWSVCQSPARIPTLPTSPSLLFHFFYSTV